MYINVKDYGATGDGVTNDSAAVQAAINAAQNATKTGVSGNIILFPPGAYIVEDVTLHRFSGALVGSGWTNPINYGAAGVYGGQGVVLLAPPDADPNKALFTITDSQGVQIIGIRFQGHNDAAHKPLAGVRLLALPNSSIGTNALLTVRDCYFGNFPWTVQGTHYGDLQHGILIDGVNANNDEFVISGCKFNRCDVGMKIVNSQSIWGRTLDCTFGDCGIGIDTAASHMLTNVRFASSGIDLYARNTANVWINGFFSESAKQLVKLGEYARVFVSGGIMQLGSIEAQIIDGYPARHNQALHLEHILFTQTPPASAKIRIKPSAGVNVSNGAPCVSIRHGGGWSSAWLDVDPVDSDDRRVVIIQTGETNTHSILSAA